MCVFIAAVLSAQSFSKPQCYITFYVFRRATFCHSLFMLKAVCCITVPSFTGQQTSHGSVQVNNECARICAICGARLPARKLGTRFYLYLPSPPLCFVGERGKGDVNSSLIEVSAQKKNVMFCFCTLPLNTKNTSHVCVRSKCRATSCRGSEAGARWNIDLRLSWP